MVKTPFHTRIQKFQPKLHGLAVGMTLGIGSTFFGQGCPLIGQCSACAACVPALSFLALPLLADGVVVLSAKFFQIHFEKNYRKQADESINDEIRTDGFKAES